MAIFNINNWFNFFTPKNKRATELKDNDLIAFGRHDEKSFNEWLPLAIRGKDLKDQILAEVPAGVSSFEELQDVPTYAGNALKSLRINATEDGVEAFVPVGGDTDTNSWGMDTVAFVSPTANFGTGAIGFANTQTSADTPNTAFRTVDEANASGASLIFLLPGYHSNVNAANGKTYFAYPEARMFRFRDNGASNITAKLRGFAKIEYGVEMTGSNNNFDIICDRFESSFFCNIGNTTLNNVCRIKADKLLQTSTWGGGYAVRGGTDCKITLECNEMETFYWLVSTRSSRCEYIVRCPKVTVKSGGGFGNQYKAFINHQGSVSNDNKFDIDFMGGTFDWLAPQTSSFGITDSALLLWVNTGSGDDSTVRFANGRVKANLCQAIRATYRVQRGEIELDNLDLSSDTNAFQFWNQAINGASQNVNVTFKSCNIESEGRCTVGNARNLKFFDTNIKVRTGVDVINFNTSNGATPGTAYFYNCNFDLVDPGEVLTNFTGVSIGLANCYGDQPVGATVTDLYAGYTQLTPFELPNLLP